MTLPSRPITNVSTAAVRQQYANGGVTQTELARTYGIDQSSVSLIVNRRLWKHLP